MRLFQGALVLLAGASAVAVLLAVTGDRADTVQEASAAASQVCEVGSQDCDAVGMALRGGAGPRASGEPAARAHDIFVDHPYPDHP